MISNLDKKGPSHSHIEKRKWDVINSRDMPYSNFYGSVNIPPLSLGT